MNFSRKQKSAKAPAAVNLEDDADDDLIFAQDAGAAGAAGPAAKAPAAKPGRKKRKSTVDVDALIGKPVGDQRLLRLDEPDDDDDDDLMMDWRTTPSAGERTIECVKTCSVNFDSRIHIF